MPPWLRHCTEPCISRHRRNVCQSVCLLAALCPSHAGTASNRPKLRSGNHHGLVAQGSLAQKFIQKFERVPLSENVKQELDKSEWDR